MKKLVVLFSILGLLLVSSGIVYAQTLDKPLTSQNTSANLTTDKINIQNSEDKNEMKTEAVDSEETPVSGTISEQAKLNNAEQTAISDGEKTDESKKSSEKSSGSANEKTANTSQSTQPVPQSTPTPTPQATPAPSSNVSANLFDTGSTGIGLLKVNFKSTSGKRIKLSVDKGGNKYIYNLTANGSTELFSLQMGSGQYTFSILENTEGSKYQTLKSETVNVNISDPLKVYLNSIQNVYWTSSMRSIAKAKELASGKAGDQEKVNAIYNFVISNISYDNGKLSRVSSDYVPSIEDTYSTKKGICYDYASLFGAMLRSVGIPAKLVKGYTPNAQGYHAWNEVYIGKWVVIDTTYDAQAKAAGVKADMIKDSSQYSKSKEY
jgi:Transglutaminase-like enzymes, putative cysteine proteases